MSTKEFKDTMASFNQLVIDLTEVVGEENMTNQIKEQLLELKKNSESDTFKVLVIGKFSSGKSTMINAILGEPLLPERATTATAIITEIRYGSKRATIYPKKGQWQGGDEPFDVSIDKLRDYLLIKHNIGEEYDPTSNTVEGNVIESPFEKMVISWPLDILKDGVEIVDSPGIDDPTCHGLVASTYLPKAHAIIYVMSGLNPYNTSDVSELEELRLRNFTTPIFVVTRYDNVKEDAYENQYDPKEYLREYKEKVNFDLKRHTDLAKKEYQDMLGASGIFYVSSREGKKAKKTIPWDNELYIQSGYSSFEKYLADYLVKCKGQEMLRGLYCHFDHLSTECVKALSEQLNAADIPLAEFETKVASVKEKLKYAQQQGKLIVNQFENELNQMIMDILPVTDSLLIEARERIPEWRDSYKSSVKMSLLHPKRSATNIANECKAHFDSCYQNFQIEWMKRVLEPKLGQGIKDIAKKLEERSNKINDTIQEIKLDLNLVDSASSETSSDAAKIVSVIYSLITWDVIGGAVGFTTGFEGLIKGIITNVLVNLAVMFVIGTVSLPVIIIGEIINFALAGVWQAHTIAKKISKKVAQSYDEALSNPETAHNLRIQVQNNLQEQFKELKKAIKDASVSDVNAINKEIAYLLEEKKKGEESVKELKARLTADIEKIEKLSEEAKKLCGI